MTARPPMPPPVPPTVDKIWPRQAIDPLDVTPRDPCHCRTCAGDRYAVRLAVIASVLLIVAGVALFICGSHGA